MRDNLFLYYGEQPMEKIKKNLVCTARVNRSEIYVGEPVTVSYKLYSALQSFSVVEKMPPFNGFSVYEIKASHDQVAELLGGKWYNAYNIRTLQLYPGEAGSFTLEPAFIKNTVTFQQSAATAPLRNPGLPDGYVPEDDIPGYTKVQFEYRSISDSPVIRVLPLPVPGKPADFSGAVGKFNIAGVCRETEVEQNSAVKVVYTISGSGNFKMINALPVTRAAAFETFDPQIKEELNEQVTPFTGKKTFEYTFSPLNLGRALIPAVAFSYFDPATKTYHTLKTDSIVLNVVPARKRDTLVQQTNTVAGDASENNNYLPYVAIGGALFIAGLLLWFRQRRKKPVKEEQEEMVDEDFWKEERDYFVQSKRSATEENTLSFYTTLNRELQMAMSELLHLQTGTTAAIYENLLQKDASLAAEYRQLAQELNNVLYAYVTPEGKPAGYLKRAMDITEALKA